VTEDNALRRPIGWWIKEADARLDAAFVSALDLHGVHRRDWQVLTSLARADASRGEIRDALAAFDEPAAVDATIQGLVDRGWLAEDPAGVLHLTENGAREREALASSVQEIRHTVADALPGEDYPTLVRLLSRLVAALPPTPD
jgi:DNA-binding MarR family transcriptional regulator